MRQLAASLDLAAIRRGCGVSCRRIALALGVDPFAVFEWERRSRTPNGALGVRSATGGTGNGRPFRPYFPGGRPVRALVAEEFRAAMAPPARKQAAPPPQPELAEPPASRCERCTYLTTAIGHKITCEDRS